MSSLPAAFEVAAFAEDTEKVEHHKDIVAAVLRTVLETWDQVVADAEVEHKLDMIEGEFQS